MDAWLLGSTTASANFNGPGKLCRMSLHTGMGVTPCVTFYIDPTRGNNMESSNLNTNKPVNKILTQQIFHPNLFNRTRSQSLSDFRSSTVQPSGPSQTNTDPESSTWTEINSRKRQRESPENDKSQKHTKLSTYWLSQPIPTSNSFSELDDGVDESQTQTERQPKPPPIFIDKVDNITPLVKLLNETVPNLFVVKVLPGNRVKIQPTSGDAYRSIIKELDSKNTEYYTYKPKQERNFKVILKYLHPSTNPGDIKEALAAKDHSATNIWNMKQAGTGNPLHMFVVELLPKQNNKDIYNIKNLLHCSVKFEAPIPKRTIPQCSNCLTYGHTKAYCRRKPRCIKCAGNHASAECSRKVRSDDVKCALCDGNHPANYKGCSIYKELQRQKFPPLRKKTFSHNKLPMEQYQYPPFQNNNQKKSNRQEMVHLPQSQTLHNGNTNYAAVVRQNIVQENVKYPASTSKDLSYKTTASEAVQPNKIDLQQASQADTNNLKELMNMFKQMMQQMTTITNLLLSIIADTRAQAPQSSRQGFAKGGGRWSTMPPRGNANR